MCRRGISIFTSDDLRSRHQPTSSVQVVGMTQEPTTAILINRLEEVNGSLGRQMMGLIVLLYSLSTPEETLAPNYGISR
jgi:hypothetical protein